MEEGEVEVESEALSKLSNVRQGTKQQAPIQCELVYRPGQTGHGRTDSMVNGEGEMDAVERALPPDELRVGCKGSETGRDGTS
eukprot:3941113-Rhodomonas_salina.1